MGFLPQPDSKSRFCQIRVCAHRWLRELVFSQWWHQWGFTMPRRRSWPKIAEARRSAAGSFWVYQGRRFVLQTGRFPSSAKPVTNDKLRLKDIPRVQYRFTHR